MKYKPTIGMEIHVHLKTKSKMFCGCENNSWKIGVEEIKSNSAICPVCTGQPGALPVANLEAIKMVVKAGLALNCGIAKKSKFDRKNYFYPDLPKGYQISQYDQPICEKGFLDIGNNRIGITRIHAEEDTGSIMHPAGEDYSLVDLNRSGAPLMELVTEPDIHSSQEAKEFCQELREVFRALNISDADMEKGQMRCEVNISISENSELGTKVEIKNLNSFKAVEKSIEYEIKRQAEILGDGGEVAHETRGWDERKQATVSQRIKEEAHDYRYFPEPDLPPLRFGRSYEAQDITAKAGSRYIDIDEIESGLPELPMAKRERFVREYGFKIDDAKILVSDIYLASYTENVVSELQNWLVNIEQVGTIDEAWEKNKEKLGGLVAGWLINKLGGLLVAKELSIKNIKITPENFAEFITLIYTNKINSSSALSLLEKMLETGGDPSNILEDEGMELIDNVAELEPLVDQVIQDNPDQVRAYQGGKEALLKFFVGQVMGLSKGKANPKMAEEMLLEKLAY